MPTRSKTSKRKLHQEPPSHILSKKLRSKLPRRRRRQISPVLLSSLRQKTSGENPRFFSVVSVDSSSGSDFAGGEASCNSSRASSIFAGKGRTNSRNGLSEEIDDVQNVERADLLRNRRFEKRIENEAEVSESSCVDSNSGVQERSRTLILKFRSGRESNDPKVNDEVSEACTKSEITCAAAEQHSVQHLKFSKGNLNRNDFISVSSGVRATSLEENKNRASESEFSQGSRSHHAGDNCADLISQSILKYGSDDDSGAGDSDLACSEQLRFSCCDDDDDDETVYCSSQETSFSELHSEIFGESSEIEFSDYTPSLFADSGSQFSEGSVGETPSPTYSLFVQYLNEFSTLASPFNASIVEEDASLQDKFARFEDSDDEDSYQLLRKRERKQVFLWNYAEAYLSATEFGELVLQQRSQMVHWIIEQSCQKQLRQETLFLGISLLDRFLGKGYFKDRRNLQILGIACLTLATRIEENQQYNRLGHKNFNIGDSVYSRCEVVAMEWVVQEVLEFQCFLPTIYSFLWFYLKAANADLVVEKRVKYLAVLALSANEQLRFWPSTVAAALVILACLELELNQNASHKVIGIHVRSKDENLHECMESLEWLLRYL
ncbi:cyclin-SDS [Lotus japonicus]|uniref:cyclin-SDS n=1 Tax=Lotus japonicus TaxID=34305 RepID=UPI002588871C|nr:cyclin-SDS [Lotus japonicus]